MLLTPCARVCQARGVSNMLAFRYLHNSMVMNNLGEWATDARVCQAQGVSNMLAFCYLRETVTT